MFNRQIRRSVVSSTFAAIEPTVVAIESCGSAHLWAQQIESTGHRVRLIPPQHVKAFVRGHKHDANDAAALAEAATRDDLPEALRKTDWQRQISIIIGRLDRRVRARTQLINQLRSVLYEYGIVIGRSVFTLRRRLPEIMEQLAETRSPLLTPIQDLIEELDDLQARILTDERKLKALASDNATCQRLMQVPGIGYLNAVSLVATVGPDSGIRNGRHMSAWIGLTPKMYGTGGKIHIDRITHRGN